MKGRSWISIFSDKKINIFVFGQILWYKYIDLELQTCKSRLRSVLRKMFEETIEVSIIKINDSTDYLFEQKNAPSYKSR